MKTGRPLNKVMMELNRQNQMKKDYIGTPQALRLFDDGQTFEIGSASRTQELRTTRPSNRQVASALGIPATYYDLSQLTHQDLPAISVTP